MTAAIVIAAPAFAQIPVPDAHRAAVQSRCRPCRCRSPRCRSRSRPCRCRSRRSRFRSRPRPRRRRRPAHHRVRRRAPARVGRRRVAVDRLRAAVGRPRAAVGRLRAVVGSSPERRWVVPERRRLGLGSVRALVVAERPVERVGRWRAVARARRTNAVRRARPPPSGVSPRATVACARPSPRAGGCLDSLSSSQRRVLKLRAGVGAQPARSRTSVARRLDVSVRRVARLENAGLRRLRALAQGGGCARSGAHHGRTRRACGHAWRRPATVRAAAAEPERGGDRARGGSGGGSGDETPPGAGGVDASPTPGSGGVEGVTQTNRPTGDPAACIDLMRAADPARDGRRRVRRRAVSSRREPRPRPLPRRSRPSRRRSRRPSAGTSRRLSSRATDCMQNSPVLGCTRPESVISYARWRHRGCAICWRRRSSKGT